MNNDNEPTCMRCGITGDSVVYAAGEACRTTSSPVN